MSQPPALDIENLRKEYNDVTALDGVSLTVPEGSFFGLLGPNGAGKTTFINILVGLVRKSGGTARVFGHDVEDDYRETRNAIGLAPQEFNVDRFFPIREVLEHKAGYHGVPASEAADRADEVLKQVGIYDKRDTRFDWLSGGMKRRFLLARALITDPDLLILDEPTAGVDVQLRRDLWELVTKLNDQGKTILLTTHYIEEAERLCDEVAILDSGQVRTVATPAELKDRGTDRIVVELRSPPTTLPDLLADDERVEAVDLDGHQLTVTARKGGLVAPQLVRELDREGIEIVDLEITRTSLEEIFVEMTSSDETGNAGDGDDAADSDDDTEDDDRSRHEQQVAPDGGQQ
ncbi:ABC transporter ATP-binding protein [Halonotius terrestris]|uniref:ABC transporter ATP-binding protein n=1 Tax=Halonotius terrestris TaxID=2487750 RepID=A0A8J8P913_9EURY|nr:ABC transporter ATP-binding protein [Halonotius terrestris]